MSVKRKPVKNRPLTQAKDKRQTKRAGGGIFDKLYAYRDNHAHALFSSLGRLVATPFSFIMTIIVLSTSISLACGFYITFINVQQFTDNLENSNQISVFLNSDLSDKDAEELAKKIRQNPQVQEVNVITKEQALVEFKNYSGFGAAMDVLDKNPLPSVLQVLAKNSLDDKAAVEELYNNLQKFDQVETVQLDMQWVSRLQSIVTVVRYIVYLFSAMIALGVVFIIGNTIRLELQSRKEEVVIAKLVGATNAFIRRPFLYTGFWLGFISSVVAWFIAAISLLILKQPVEQLSGLYESDLHLVFLSLSETVTLLGIPSFLGVISSWTVLIFQLRQIRPT